MSYMVLYFSIDDDTCKHDNSHDDRNGRQDSKVTVLSWVESVACWCSSPSETMRSSLSATLLLGTLFMSTTCCVAKRNGPHKKARRGYPEHSS